MKYTKAIYIYYKREKHIIFESKWISTIDILYGNYALM